MKEDNLRFLKEQRSLGRRIFGFGAPVKGNTLLNYFGVGTDMIECLVEKNELRRGLYSPGMHIPVVMERELKRPPDMRALGGHRRRCGGQDPLVAGCQRVGGRDRVGSAVESPDDLGRRTQEARPVTPRPRALTAA